MSNYDNNMKGALWLKTSKNGMKYMAGSITINNVDYDIAMFKNDSKTGSQPDYRLTIKDKSQTVNNQVQNTRNDNAQKVTQVFNGEPVNPWANDNEIPF